MTDDRRPDDEADLPDDEADLPEDIDPGEPIAELAGLRRTPGPNFLARIRGGVQRRMLVSQFLDLTMPTFLRIFMEYVSMLFALFGSGQERQEEDRPWKTDSD